MPATVVVPLLLGVAFALQPPEQFHGGEAVARDGEQWSRRPQPGDVAVEVARFESVGCKPPH